MESCAVLVSGGLDSAVLLVERTASHSTVYPLFVESGFPWEATELWHLRRFLDAIHLPASAVQPLHVLSLPVTDLYGDHWSLSGQNVPDAGSPDSAVFLPGRNVLLLAKAMLWGHLHAVPAVAFCARPLIARSCAEVVTVRLALAVKVLLAVSVTVIDCVPVVLNVTWNAFLP